MIRILKNPNKGIQIQCGHNGVYNKVIIKVIKYFSGIKFRGDEIHGFIADFDFFHKYPLIFHFDWSHLGLSTAFAQVIKHYTLFLNENKAYCKKSSIY